MPFALMLMCAIYWGLNKKAGIYLLYCFFFSVMVNLFIKHTACIYRPWILDGRVSPPDIAFSTAGGYSFPSGHTMMATPIYGGLACITKNKIVKIFWLALILITMFSRNYLGVHTPQDVLVGFVLGAASIYIAKKFLDFLDDKPEKFGLAMLFLGFCGALILVYVTFKPYPMDYVDGKLLVDPVKMTRDAWGDAGGLIPLAIAWYIDRRWIKFSETGLNVKGVILSVIGLAILAWMTEYLKVICNNAFGVHAGKFAYQFAFFFFVMILWPIIIKTFTKKKEEIK